VSSPKSLLVHDEQLPAGLTAIPVRTRLVRPGDDMVALTEQAVCGIARPGDVVAVAESAVAIAQGEFLAAEHVRPSPLAYAIARRADPMATISQPESIQLVIDRAGAWKVGTATLLQALGRVFGRRGLFYEIMGDAVAAFDGYTGTMPPYERAIVFAPRNPDGFAAALRDGIGIESAIVDANDLKRAKVLGASSGICRRALERALLENPHGNSDEQTPIVVLKWRGAGRNPLLEERA
jgi:F420-0:Gamma-glutamyl ligase